MRRAFKQVDVFTDVPYQGNPVAVVVDGEDLSTEQMQELAAWTNLSETTFVTVPRKPGADYKLRIFAPARELPFAGHPTLGTCHAWLEAGGVPAKADVIVQECAAGLIEIRHTDDGLAFGAPPLVRGGPVEDEMVERIASVLGIERGEIVDTQWVDNGPGWVAALLESADAVLAARPAPSDLDLGLVGMYPEGSDAAIEVRGFFPKDGLPVEDPVTGSLNASLAGWLLETGRLTAPYVASQGTAIGRAGRVHISQADDGTILVGGGTVTCIEGHVYV